MKFTIAAFLIDRGSISSVHRKIYLPTYGMFEELRYFSPGNRVRAFDSNEIRRARRFSRHFLDEGIQLVLSELRRISKSRDR